MVVVSDKALAGLIGPGEVVLIGELHGTNEFPQLVGRLARLALDMDLPVVVGLEIPTSEQPAIDAFLASAGQPADRAELTASPFWHRPQRHDDGRSGHALIELFDTLRAGGAQARLSVCAFDQPWGQEGRIATPEEARALSQPRDQFMTETLDTAIERSIGGRGGTFTVVLAGNVHTRIVRYPGIDEPHLGELLSERYPNLVALEGHWTGGQFRASTSPRGAEVHDASPIPTETGSVGRHDRPEQIQRYGHHGWVNVGTLSPSLPVG